MNTTTTTTKKDCQRNPLRVSKLLTPPQGAVTASVLYQHVFPLTTKKVIFPSSSKLSATFCQAKQSHRNKTAGANPAATLPPLAFLIRSASCCDHSSTLQRLKDENKLK